MRRRHEVLTVPSGGVLFACLALPGYRECGRDIAMRDNPLLVAVCLVGVVVLVSALAAAGRRAEFGFSIASCILAIGALSVLVFGLVMVKPVYAGLTVGAAAAIGLVGGTILWIQEVRGLPVRFAVGLLAMLAVIGLAVVAVGSRWTPLPPEHTAIELGPLPDLGPLLVH